MNEIEYSLCDDGPMVICHDLGDIYYSSYVVFPSGIYDPDVEYVAVLSTN